MRACVAHDGRHQDVGGQCVPHGAAYAWRVGRCRQPGCLELVGLRTTLSTGEVTVLEAGSDRPHTHPPGVDASALAEGIATGIVEGFRAARSEQRAEQRQPRRNRQ